MSPPIVILLLISPSQLSVAVAPNSAYEAHDSKTNGFAPVNVITGFSVSGLIVNIIGSKFLLQFSPAGFDVSCTFISYEPSVKLLNIPVLLIACAATSPFLKRTYE